MSCFGKALDRSSHEGWFELDDIGEYRDRVEFIPQMHGGIIFFRKDECTQKIYQLTLKIAADYGNYKFKYFEKPADEPILALAMAVNGCKPIEVQGADEGHMFCFRPAVRQIKPNIRQHFLEYTIDGHNWIDTCVLLHWQNVFTKTPLYWYEVTSIETYGQSTYGKLSGWIGFLLNCVQYYILRTYHLTGHLIKKSLAYKKKHDTFS